LIDDHAFICYRVLEQQLLLMVLGPLEPMDLSTRQPPQALNMEPEDMAPQGLAL
jgi:hypothetical protein